MSQTGLATSGDEVRAAFDAASDWYLSVLVRVPVDAWDRPGLGVWTVKELLPRAPPEQRKRLWSRQ